LIVSGSARKYLLYAIGETALVVIGILIALSINNWNENNTQRVEERRILVDLKNEVNLAIESKTQLRERYQSKVDTLAFALDKLFSTERKALSDSECNTVAMTHIFDWEPSSISTIEELVASGKINLIRSEERNWDGKRGIFTCDVATMKNNRHFLAQLQSNRGRTGGLVGAADSVIDLLKDIYKLIEVQQ
jgi:hypothetical protein